MKSVRHDCGICDAAEYHFSRNTGSTHPAVSEKSRARNPVWLSWVWAETLRGCWRLVRGRLLLPRRLVLLSLDLATLLEHFSHTLNRLPNVRWIRVRAGRSRRRLCTFDGIGRNR